jgi:hypothetical protein
MQFNLHVVREKDITLLKDITENGFYLPLYWIDQTAQAPESKISELKSKVSPVREYVIGFYVFLHTYY